MLRRSGAWVVTFCICATAILPGFLAGCSAYAAPAGLLINEVVTSNSRSLIDPVLGSPDWIELCNPTDKDIDLAGYRLTDKIASAKGLLPEATVPAGGYIVVYAVKGGEPSGSNQCCVDFSLSKGGVTLYLINPQNTVVNQLIVPALPGDISFARRDDGSYGLSTGPTPGKANNSAAILDSSALQSALKERSLVINEVLPRVSEGYPWAELYNSGTTNVDLSDYCLTDAQNSPDKWHLPPGMLAPGQYAVVTFSGLDKANPDMEASFKLGSQDTGLYLFDVMGKLVNDLTWYKEIPPGLSVVGGNRYTAVSTKGTANSTDTFVSMAPATMDSSDPVRISEVLPKNKYSAIDSDGDHEEWVELYNGSAQDISLKGYCLSDSRNNPFKWAFPDSAKIAAGGYLVVFLSGKQSKPGELHASFRLNSSEGFVYLTSLGTNGIRVDSMPIPSPIRDDISVGRDTNGNPQYYAQPTPGAPNAQGHSDLSQIGKYNKNGVYISEVCAANKPKSHINDWIELHNGSDSDVDLTGCYLSDSSSKPEMWKIPSLKIGAGGYAVIEASSNTQDANVANFSISPSGETLLLCNAQGNVMDAFETGVLSPGVTSGRIEGDDSVGRVYFTTPTRGKPNSAQTLSGYAQTPVFSTVGLYHTSPFALSVACSTSGAKIYYTTDGSVPTNASKPYTGPIPVSKNTAVRAVAYADGCLPSEVATETYLFDAPHTVPVLCIAGNPRDMNILIKTDKRNYKPEYAANVEYYETNGTLGTSFPSGMRPKGRSSLLNPQNSYTLSLRSDYGQKSVTYPFFTDSSITHYTSLCLRDAGQDNTRARMRDSFVQTCEKGIDDDNIDTRLVVVYINGVYCGLYDLNEDQTPDYLASHYKIAPSNVDMIERDGKIIAGDNAEFLRVMQFAKTQNTADDAVFQEFSKMVDVDACTDYLISKLYFGDGDVQNQRFWRAQDYSVKWRPLMFDLDWSIRFNDASRSVYWRYFKPVQIAGNGTETDMYIFCALYKNKAWRDQFVRRFVQLAETQFSPDRIIPIFDAKIAAMQPEMAQHIERWHTPKSMAVWLKETAGLRAALIKRQAIALRQMQVYFHVPASTMQEYIAEYSGKN